MTPAKITNLNPVQVTYEKTIRVFVSHDHEEFVDVERIAEVENVIQWHGVWKWSRNGTIRNRQDLSLNQQVFIEPTTEGKVKIVKLN